AQMLGGIDPDYHRRDLADSIESGAYPQWELGVQVFPDTDDETFEGIDLLDPTKIVPEEQAPVQAIGLLTLTKNPTNFFAETEQIAFHLGNLVPGIDVTNDPLLQARLFSYLDTQLTRLGGPNFHQIPINRPHAPVNDMLRDGFHQDAVHGGVAPYQPNSLDGGNPFPASGSRDRAFVEVPVRVAESVKTRANPASFDDHYSQVRQFWLSMTPPEREHIVLAYTFELSRCYEQVIRERQLRALANIDADLCAQVAAGLGLAAPDPSVPLVDLAPSPALSQIGGTWPTAGRMVGIVVDPDGDLDGVEEVAAAVKAAGMVPLVVAPHGGTLPSGMAIQRSFGATRSVEFDALLVAGLTAPTPDARPARDSKAGEAGAPVLDPRVVLLLQECFRHAKVIGAWGAGIEALAVAGIGPDEAGVVTGDNASEVFASAVALLGSHRVWERFGPVLA
ncbi:MAG: catalase, partial [Nocardioides sp.]